MKANTYQNVKIVVDQINDQAIIKRLALNGNKVWIRCAAVEKLNDQVALLEIALEEPSKRSSDRWRATDNDEDNYADVHATAIRKMTDQNLIAKVVDQSGIMRLMYLSVRRLTDQTLLAKLATSSIREETREACVVRLTDQNVLAKVAQFDKESRVREVAVEKLNAPDILIKIIIEDRDKHVRNAAESKLYKMYEKHELNMILDSDSYNKFWEVARAESEERLLMVEQTNDMDSLARFALNDSWWKVREAAILKLDDQEILAKIASGDNDFIVAKTAIEKVIDQSLLEKIANEAKYLEIKAAAVSKLTNQEKLQQLAVSGDGYVRRCAIGRVNNQKFLKTLVIGNNERGIRVAAVERLTDQKLLAKMSINDRDVEVRAAAVEKLIDDKLLAKLVLDKEYNVRLSAVKNINLEDMQLLEKLAKDDKEFYIRCFAAFRIPDEKILAIEANNLSNGHHRSHAKLLLNELRQQKK